MNPGVTSERVFAALKEHILSGAVLPGEKLEPHLFADQLNSSVTPVRDALHRLAGERLVDMRASEGFYLPLVTEPGLRDLYQWNADLIRLATRHWRADHVGGKADTLAADVGRATAMFFALFATRSGNREHTQLIDHANDRLATPRVAERRVLDDLEAELRALAVTFDNGTTSALLALVARYHRRRLHATPAIVRALYG
ncbi:MAG TPA: GntR family transcriptional regulator [Sphingomonas sp.]